MKQHNLKFILTDQTLTIYHNARSISIHRTQVGENLWHKAIDALRAGDVDTLVRYADPSGSLVVYSGGLAEVRNGKLYVNDILVDTYAAQKAIEFMHLELPFEPIVRFIERLEQNPSYRARQELYQFLEVGRLPLTQEGYFIAYKRVTRDPNNPNRLIDIYTRSIDNTPGTVVSMPRNQVDEDPNRTCSAGLHVCSFDYLPHYRSSEMNDVVVSVKVDPADVVAVPKDYNNTKMRVCRYEVLEILEDYQNNPLTKTPFVDVPAGEEDNEEEEDLDEDFFEEEDDA